MGKKRHSQDKLWITYKELVQDWGGKTSEEQKGSKVQQLPFFCCSLSLMPFKDAVCFPDGTIFDIVNILPYLRKYKRNPVSGKPAKVTDLIKLHFHKNAEGEYHCPITFKVFNDNSVIIAISESGNVFSSEAFEELNKKPKYFKDLLTDEPFDPKNIIIIQDPNKSNKRLVSEFNFVKNNEDVEFINRTKDEDFFKDPTNFVNISSTYSKLIEDYDKSEDPDKFRRIEVLNMINNNLNIKEEDERTKSIKKEYEDYLKRVKEIDNLTNIGANEMEKFKKTFRMSTNCFVNHLRQTKSNLHETSTDNKTAGSLTSTATNVSGKNSTRTLTDEELRTKYIYQQIKAKHTKGFVRINTNFGYLNVQVHCDLAPRTSENFLELCEEGYYNKTAFHRLVKGFVLQGGDPSGTGKGGIIIYGKTFNDEFVPELNHCNKGTLSMANSGKHTNGSQFFITLRNSKHSILDNKHSVFGEVVGNIKILDDIESVGSDEKEHPKKEVKILNIEVFANPFREVVCEFLIKEFSEQLSNQKDREAIEKDKIIEERINSFAIAKDEQVGKYLNKKREAVRYQTDDPYAFDKNNIKMKSKTFKFKDW